MRTLYKNIISFRKCMEKRSHNPQSPILCFIPADNAITWFLFELLAHNSRFSHITNPFQCLHNAHTIDFCWKSAIGSPICFGISEYQQKSGSLVFVQNSSLQFQILKQRGNEKKKLTLYEKPNELKTVSSSSIQNIVHISLVCSI